MKMVSVRRGDLALILDEANANVSWPKETWKALDRLIDAAGGFTKPCKCHK
jgi:hypothetical protein